MQYFYQAGLLPGEKSFLLNAEESHHAVKVLRHGRGDLLAVLNGKGGIISARILQPDARGCEMEITEFRQEAPILPAIHIALALLKNRDRMEWFVEKAVEAGASRLSFFTSGHAEKKGFNQERMERIAVTALKQSGNTWLPEIRPVLPLEKLLTQTHSGMKFIAYCPVDTTQHLRHQYRKGEEAIVLIGPEGDFTPEEVAEARRAGFLEVSLGKNRLRAETAALVSLLTLRLENE